jgi:hypothetical protein
VTDVSFALMQQALTITQRPRIHVMHAMTRHLYRACDTLYTHKMVAQSMVRACRQHLRVRTSAQSPGSKLGIRQPAKRCDPPFHRGDARDAEQSPSHAMPMLHMSVKDRDWREHPLWHRATLAALRSACQALSARTDAETERRMNM